MSDFIRQSSRTMRLWLLAAAAMLLFTSIIEASHIHGTFVDTDDHCVLCQHSVALDKVLTTASSIVLPLLLVIFIALSVSRFTPNTIRPCALIRAPPAKLPAH